MYLYFAAFEALEGDDEELSLAGAERSFGGVVGFCHCDGGLKLCLLWSFDLVGSCMVGKLKNVLGGL